MLAIDGRSKLRCRKVGGGKRFCLKQSVFRNAAPITGMELNPSAPAQTADSSAGKQVHAGKSSGKPSPRGQADEHHNAPTAESQMMEAYDHATEQLLILASTLYARACSIYREWAEAQLSADAAESVDASASALWAKCWLPLLQTMARLCCDCRRRIRTRALDAFAVGSSFCQNFQ